MRRTALALTCLLLAAPALAKAPQARAWRSYDDAPIPYLQYSHRRGADARRTTVACEGRLNFIQVEQGLLSRPAASDDGTMKVNSGAFTQTAPSTDGPDERDGGDGLIVSAVFPSDSPVMAAFARSGKLDVTTHGLTALLPPAPRQMVRSFMAICRQRH